MSPRAEALRLALAKGPASAQQLLEILGVSQPTVSRALAALGQEVLRIGAGPSIHYALRDSGWGLSDIPVYRVTAEGKLRKLGTLVPVRPAGFVMQQEDGKSLHSHGLPWWLCDARPQGFLGRVFAEHHAASLGLPSRLNEWSDSHALRALLAHGHDAMGNLLLGDTAYERFLSSPAPQTVQPEQYAELAEAAERGELPGSSAGGEQPKFTAFNGRHHVLVKFTAAPDNPVTRRWRDLLAAEQLAAQVLLEAGIPAAQSRLLDIAERRFLAIERFDRVGSHGRRALHSLAALEAEFIGDASAAWPSLTARLATQGLITPEAANITALLHAFGSLIGNSDMHNGNLSFMSEHGRPYRLAPAYDMLPMAFAPRSGGLLPTSLPPLHLRADIAPDIWRQAQPLAERFVQRLAEDARLSKDWQPCTAALQQHLSTAAGMIERLE